MKADNVTGKSRNLIVTVMAVTTVITLLFSSALVTVPEIIEAPAQKFAGPGYIYSVEYECGTQTNKNDPQAQPGEYSTNILIHNPFTEDQQVFAKVLPERGLPTKSVWIDDEVESQIVFLFTIGADEVLQIDCADITTAGGDASQLSSVFSKGLLIISHPVKVDSTSVLVEQPLFGDESLDVTAAYTYKGTVEIKHFNKVIVKKKVLNPSDGAVTSTISELLIPVKTGSINSTQIIDIKAQVNYALTCNAAHTICEVISINYGITNEGESGISKHVETIKGKFVPFVPLPEEPTQPPSNGDDKNDDNGECKPLPSGKLPNTCEFLFFQKPLK